MEAKTLYKKLLAVQEKLKAPKSQYNSFGKYNFRNLEDILEAVKPLLVANGLALHLTDDVVQIGARFYVMATAILHDIDDGDEMRVTAFAREEEEKKGMDGSQVTGASSSYARKYALNGLFAIDDTKDSDTTNTGTVKPSQAESKSAVASKPTSITYEQACIKVFGNGKHKGETYKQVFDSDPEYLNTLCSSDKIAQSIKDAVKVIQNIEANKTGIKVTQKVTDDITKESIR